MQGSPLTVEMVDAAEQIYVHNLLHLLAISFLFYDHLITSGNEVDYLWRRPKTQSAYWFFFNRYFSFFGNIVVTVLGFTTLHPEVRISSFSALKFSTLNSGGSCKQYNLFRQLMLIINQVLICVLLTLRIYALFSCSFRILAYMVSSGAVLAGVSCWALFGQKSAPAEQGSGCHIALERITAIRLAGAWEALFVYDSILFSLTMFKTYKSRNEFALSQAKHSIIYLIFRDGAIYFAVMALANLANIMTFYFCGPFMRGGLSTFASAISVTMMSRLMLNLHETADAGIYSTTRTTNLTDTEMECRLPSGAIELDTLWTGDMHNSISPPNQNFSYEEGNAGPMTSSFLQPSRSSQIEEASRP